MLSVRAAPYAIIFKFQHFKKIYTIKRYRLEMYIKYYHIELIKSYVDTIFQSTKNIFP